MISIATILFTVLVVWFVLQPQLEAQHSGLVTDPNAMTQQLLDQKERCLQVLRDLELDFSTKKVSDADYQAMKMQATAELAGVLQRLDGERQL